ncbi:MAG: serine/threonine protein kinase [Verrucomicrobiaceae bacterium]|nr:serine/threonine protein kinase [Verrucomicrobiaceae bacterium]
MPASEPATHHCPTCGAILDSSDAGGLCVACLLGEALEPGEPGRGLGSIGGHELIEIIARGGMGIVYRARQRDPAREVALKALPGAELMSEEARQRFRIEAQAMARLQHPAIVPIYELGEEDGTPFFTMKFAAGGCLAQRIHEFKGRWRESAELIATIAEAVHYAHERGVLHRDLKPGNVLFDEGGQALVSDFGLAKIIGEEADLTRTITLMGTPNYMAPELTRGGKDAVTTACDVWSLGVMLYELLAGHTPFRGENLATILRQLNEAEPEMLPREVPRDLAIIAGKALQKTPGRRYASAQGLADDLHLWLAGEAIMARRQPVAERCWRWLRRRPVWAAAALLVVGGIVLLVWNEHRLSQRNADLSQGLSDALVKQVAGGLQSEDLLTRHVEWMRQLQQAAELAPTHRVRSMTASVLAMPRVVQMSSHHYREYRTRGEAIAVSGDLKLRLTHRHVHLGGGERVIELTALDAPLNDAPAIWRRQLPADSAIFADMNDEGTRVVFTNGSASELWDTQADRQIGEIAVASLSRPRLGKLWFADLHPAQPLLAWIDPQGALWAWRFPQGDKIRLGEPMQPVHGLVWSAAGDQIATSNPGGVQLWQAAAPAPPAAIAWAGASDALAWSAQGLVVGHIQQPEAAVIRDGQIACVLRTGATRLTRFDAFPGTWQALAVSADSKGWLWDMRDGRTLVRFGAGQIILKAGTDGHHFAASRDNVTMSTYEITHDPVFREFDCPHVFPEGAVSAILRVSADGRSLITRTKTALLIWDRKQGRLAAEWPIAGDTKPSFVFSPDGRVIFASQKNSPGLYRRTIEWKDDVLQLGEPELVPGTAGQTVWQIDRSGTRYLLQDARGQSIWEGTERGPSKEISRLETGSHDLRLSASFTYGYEDSLAYRVMPIYAGLSDQVVKRITIDRDGEWAGRALFTRDERWMIAHTRSYYRLFSVDDWRQRFEIPYSVASKSYGKLALSPDGHFAALEQSSDRFAIVTIPEGRRLVELHALTTGEVIGMSFTADGRGLLLLNRQNRLYEWDLAAFQAELVKMGLSW